MALQIARVTTDAPSLEEAVRALQDGLDPDAEVVLVFASTHYDTERLGRALAERWGSRVVGCTSAGVLGDGGYSRRGLAAVSLSGDSVRVRIHMIDLDALSSAVDRVAADLAEAPRVEGEQAFALLLVDGLSHREERLTSALYTAIGDLPLLGGSAGDDLRFERTEVLAEGVFRSGCAVLVTVYTRAPVAFFRLHHHVPTQRRAVVTSADTSTRVVHRLNGLPAAQVYADAVGMPVSALDSVAFSQSPFMVHLGGEPFIRSVQSVLPDGSLRFYCVMEPGLVLTLAEPGNPFEALDRALADIYRDVGVPELILGFDCILRRVELESSGIARLLGRRLAEERVVGFSTYGEQFNGLHMNQTMVGVALGAGRPR